MNKVIWAIGLALICTVHGYSQTAQTRSRTAASSEATASASKGKSIDIASGTRLAGELQNTIDVRKAKVGDEVVLKTTQAIKSEGRTIVKKGARLIGHVTEVSQKTEGNGESRVGLLFDRLESGSLDVAIVATITSITKSQANALSNDTAAGGSSSMSTQPTASGQRTSSSGSVVGGVVGGVTNAVGGVVNTTTGVVGNTTATVGPTVNNSTSAVGRSLGKIQISESTDASASGGSVLSVRGDNLRIEKGTTFNLVLTQSASAGTPQ